MQLTEEEIRGEAEKHYGTDINSFGQQRDGYVKGFSDCQQSNQPRPIVELDSEYRGRILLYEGEKLSSGVFTIYHSEHVFALQTRINSKFTHFFIPPTLVYDK